MTGGKPRAPHSNERHRADSPRALARRALDRVAADQAWATLALDGELARAALDERDRRLAAELVYGVLRRRDRLDRALAAHADLRRAPPRLLTALRVAAYQLLFLDRVPAYAAVDDAVSAARAFGGARLAGFANAVLRKVGAAREPALPEEPRARLALEASLPPWILDELAVAVGEGEALAVAARAFAEQAPLFLRCNSLRTTAEALIARLAEEGVTAEPCPNRPGALRTSSLGDPAQSAAFRAGWCTVQDLSAQAVALALAPAAGQRVLDACAGVGGKATHLAELAGDAGQVEAVDLSATKLGLLRDSAARLGLRSIHSRVLDLTSPAFAELGSFDKILLDAPCSGLGVLRRHPDAKWRQAASSVAELVPLQARLLDAVIGVLAPGGALVYSVCTFTEREGRGQVRAALARHPQLSLEREEQTWPHLDGGDAFYLARLVRAR